MLFPSRPRVYLRQNFSIKLTTNAPVCKRQSPRDASIFALIMIKRCSSFRSSGQRSQSSTISVCVYVCVKPARCRRGCKSVFKLGVIYFTSFRVQPLFLPSFSHLSPLSQALSPFLCRLSGKKQGARTVATKYQPVDHLAIYIVNFPTATTSLAQRRYSLELSSHPPPPSLSSS